MSMGVLATLALVRCGGEGEQAEDGDPASRAPTIIATHSGGTAVSACSPRGVAQLMVDFLAAAETGNDQAVESFIGADFERFSIGVGRLNEGGRSFDAYSAAELLDYFASRRAHGEQLRLRAVDVASDGGSDIAQVLFALVAEADDLDPGERSFGGKGAVNCATGAVIAMFMASPAEKEFRTLCEPAPGDIPSGAVLVCARRA